MQASMFHPFALYGCADGALVLVNLSWGTVKKRKWVNQPLYYLSATKPTTKPTAPKEAVVDNEEEEEAKYQFIYSEAPAVSGTARSAKIALRSDAGCVPTSIAWSTSPETATWVATGPVRPCPFGGSVRGPSPACHLPTFGLPDRRGRPRRYYCPNATFWPAATPDPSALVR